MHLQPSGPASCGPTSAAAPACCTSATRTTSAPAPASCSTPACCAAKIAWLVDHEADRFESARWILAPRDYVAARLTGEVLTDETLASRTGLYGLDGTVGVAEEIGTRLPPVRAAARRPRSPAR